MTTASSGPRTLPGVAVDSAAQPSAGWPARVLPPGQADLLRYSEHFERFGPLPVGGSARTSGGVAAELVEKVERSGLRGRGGAGFPTARKLRAVLAGRGRPVVVANGTEGEPASSKDVVLLSRAPHLVLDGAVAAAEAVGANEVLLCVGRATSHARVVMARAIEEREAAAVDDVHLRLFDVPDRFVAGEETALVHWLNGGDAKPTFTPPRPFQRGVRGRPTLVQNVETLAHLALIARFGPGWFRTAGVPADPGTALVTVTGAVAAPVVVEVPVGTSLAAVVDAAGRATEPLQAFLVGGFFGGWVPVSLADRFALGHDARGGLPSMGSGVIVAVPEGVCCIAETVRILRYLADEGAGQCGPCVFGLPSLARGVQLLAAGKDRDARDRLVRLGEQVAGRGACRHPDAAVRLVRSLLEAFPAEIRAHGRGPCGREDRAVVPVPRPQRPMLWR